MMTPPELIAFVAGFPILLAHLGIGLFAFLIWATFYSLISAGKEIGQIRDGNPASATIYGATLLALALPLGKVLTTTTGLIDLGLWSLVAGLVQLTLFIMVGMVLAGLSKRIRDHGDTSAALLLGGARLATAWLFSCALTV